MIAPNAYVRSREDEEDARDAARPRTYVRNATHEQSMGAGALPEFEVPLPEDEDALPCPDKMTKMEWDAVRFAPQCLERKGFGPDTDLSVTDAQLRWLRPESQGGCTA